MFIFMTPLPVIMNSSLCVDSVVGGHCFQTEGKQDYRHKFGFCYIVTEAGALFSVEDHFFPL